MKKLYITDLDGTLYSDDKTVSKQNLEAIEYFKSEGGLFTFITGRVPQTTGEMCETIKPNAPYGCNNGGGIYDHIQDKYLWKTFISDEVASTLIVFTSSFIFSSSFKCLKLQPRLRAIFSFCLT